MTDFSTFRLHNGGNDFKGGFFTDAFVQRLCENTAVSTTAYAPCVAFLNGEFWGIYGMREHYNDVYFAQNYNVDKKNVILLDRAWGNGGLPYQTEVKEGDEETAYALLEELMTRLQDMDCATEEGYRQFTELVDADSLIDLILINGYVGNWDFMQNNFRFWRTEKVEEGNPYADTRWRFCLHDCDFSFEEDDANNGLTAAAQAEGKSYFDYFIGNAPLTYNDVGYLSEECTRIFTKPLESAAFRARIWERAQVIAAAFDYDGAKQVLEEMKQEIAPLYEKQVYRWYNGYSYTNWESVLEARRLNVKHRAATFFSQIISAFGLDV